jgi:hypothetical protein
MRSKNMEVFEIYLSVLAVIAILGLLLGFTSYYTSSEDEDESNIIIWSDLYPHKVRIYAPYPNAKVLDKAKRIVDHLCPYVFRPHGGTFMVILQREFYLNKYLWFYNSQNRFPSLERLADKPPSSYGFPYKHKAIPAGKWYVPNKSLRGTSHDN